MAAVLAIVRVPGAVAAEADRYSKEAAESGSGTEVPGTAVLVQRVSSVCVQRHLAEGRLLSG
jgi:hypothetical protein